MKGVATTWLFDKKPNGMKDTTLGSFGGDRTIVYNEIC